MRSRLASLRGYGQTLFEVDNRPTATAILLLAVLLAVHGVTWLLDDVFAALSSQTTDRLFRLRSSYPDLLPGYSGTVIHVDIDDRGLRERDDPYFERDEHARLVRNLGRATTALQVHDVIFAAPQSLAADRDLVEATREAGNVFFGYSVGLAAAGEGVRPEPSSEIEAAMLEHLRFEPRVEGERESLPHSARYLFTFPPLARAARGLGYLDIVPDSDGVYRRLPLVVRDDDGFLPSMPLALVASYLHVDLDEITIEPGDALTLHGAVWPGTTEPVEIAIPIDDHGRMRINFRGPWGSMQHYGFGPIFDASDDRFMMEDLEEEIGGKIAVVSFVSTGSGDIGPVPTDPIFPLSGLLANATNTILSGDFLYELSPLAMLLAVELPLLAILLLGALRLPTLGFVAGSILLGGIYVVVAGAAFLFAGWILDIPGPLIVLAGATVVVASFHYHLESEARAKVLRELAVARDIQMRTLPAEMPAVAGYDLGGFSEPADQTGGDSFDVVTLAGGGLVMLLADATGHGIGPALSVTQVRAMLRVSTRLGADLDAILRHVNDQLSDDLSANRFVTAFLGSLDPQAHAVRYHAAGQGPLLVWRAADARAEWLGSTTIPLGWMSHLKPPQAETIHLAPGDILGLMTDGVFECENPADEQFGQERVEQLVRDNAGLSMSELARRIFAAVTAFRKTRPQADDVTILLVRRTV